MFVCICTKVCFYSKSFAKMQTSQRPFYPQVCLCLAPKNCKETTGQDSSLRRRHSGMFPWKPVLRSRQTCPALCSEHPQPHSPFPRQLMRMWSVQCHSLHVPLTPQRPTEETPWNSEILKAGARRVAQSALPLTQYLCHQRGGNNPIARALLGVL